jgi:hypothetical protein
MEKNKITAWHFVIPALFVCVIALIVACYDFEVAIVNKDVSIQILQRRNHLLDSIFTVSDKEDDSLRNRCDSLERSRIQTLQDAISFGHSVDTGNTIRLDSASIKFIHSQTKK